LDAGAAGGGASEPEKVVTGVVTVLVGVMVVDVVVQVMVVVVWVTVVTVGPVFVGPVFVGPVFVGPVVVGPVFVGPVVELVTQVGSGTGPPFTVLGPTVPRARMAAAAPAAALVRVLVAGALERVGGVAIAAVVPNPAPPPTREISRAGITRARNSLALTARMKPTTPGKARTSAPIPRR